MGFLTYVFSKKPPNYFISQIGKFINQFDRAHPEKSASQVSEVKKFARIFYLRDHVIDLSKKAKVWERF